MLTVKWELASGESGQAELDGDAKWTFGRVGGDEPPTVTTNDIRVSRNALTIRDSGPGPVVFCGQRGDGVRVVIVSADGSERPITQGTAVNLGEGARRIEVAAADEVLLTVQVYFDLRPTVKERQAAQDEGPADDSSDD
ncbi:MAG: hypothetical protein ACJ71Z_01445 [Aeromicrobium sp.]